MTAAGSGEALRPYAPSDSAAAPLVGGVEAGGTKFVCAVGSGPTDIRAELRFPTTTPEETLARTTAFFREWQEAHPSAPLEAVGLGSFGPVDPDPSSPTWGYITSTPKPGWADVDIAGAVASALDLAVGFDTDVNAAALGEWRWGAARGLDPVAYITVGTGIGSGGLLNGELMHGLMHPEIGHIRVPHDRERDPYPGRCPYHGDCLEGLASGPAIAERWGRPAEELAEDHAAWALEAEYLGHALATLTLVLSPRRIVLGGGVMGRRGLHGLVRRRVSQLLAGYIRHPLLDAGMERYIVPPGLGDRAGLLGAFELARRRLPAT